MTTPLVACFCRLSVDVPPGEEFAVVVCPGCAQAWAVWVVDGALASQVMIDAGTTFEDVWYRLRLYGIRAHVHEWESAEVRALFSAVYAARLRWERFDPWGRRVVWLFGLPGLRWLKGAPFWVVARIFGRWAQPPHLRGRTATGIDADVAHYRRIALGRCT